MQITTVDEFRARVQVSRTSSGVAAALLGLAALLLVRNVVATVRSLGQNPGAGFWDLFFTTTGEQGTTSGSLVVIVWGPVVLLAVSAVLLLWVLATRSAHLRRLFEQFRAAGWVAEQVPTALQVRVGNQESALALLTGPGLGPDAVGAMARDLAGWLSTLRPEEVSTVSAAVAKRAGDGYWVDATLPVVRPGVLAITYRAQGRPVVVIPTQGQGTPTILPLRAARG